MKIFNKRLIIITLSILAFLILIIGTFSLINNKSQKEPIKKNVKIEAFSLLEPNNNTENVSLQPTFKWEKAKNAIKYILIISENKEFSTIFLEIKNIAAESFMLSEALLYDKTYFWKVLAIGEENSLQAKNSGISFKTKKPSESNKEIIIDDFDGYKNNDILRSIYTVHEKGDKGQISLNNSYKKDGIYSLAFSYELNKEFWVACYKTAPIKLSGTNGISLWIKPDGNNNKLSVDLTEFSGEVYRAVVQIKGDEPYEIFIPFSKFEITGTIKDNERLELNLINQLGLGFSGGTTKGTIYIDSILAYIGDNADIINNGVAYKETNIIDDFSTYKSNKDLNDTFTRNINGDYSVLELSKTASFGDKNVLKWKYNLNKEYYTMFTKKLSKDISKSNVFEVVLIPDGNNNDFNVVLVEQSGEIWKAKFKLSGTKPLTIKLPFSLFTRDTYPEDNKKLDLDKISTVGYSVSGNQGEGQIYVKHIICYKDTNNKLTYSGYNVPNVSLIDGFSQYESDKKLKESYKKHSDGDNITPILNKNSLYEDSNSLQIDYDINTKYWATLNSSTYMNLSGCVGISLWLKPDAFHNNLSITLIEASGEVWTLTHKMSGLEPYVLFMPFSNASYYEPDKVNGKLELDTIIGFNIGVSGSGSGTIYIDSIKALNDYDIKTLKDNTISHIVKLVNELPNPDSLDETNADVLRNNIGKVNVSIKTSEFLGITNEEIGTQIINKVKSLNSLVASYIDCFEGYADNTALLKAYSNIVPTNMQAISLSLSDTSKSGKGLSINYSGIMNEPYFVGTEKIFQTPMDFSEYLGLEIYVIPDGTQNAFTISLKDANAVTFSSVDESVLKTTIPKKLRIPFSSFKGEQSATISLKSIISLGLFIGARQADVGTINIDSIRLYSATDLEKEKHATIQSITDKINALPINVTEQNCKSVQTELENINDALEASYKIGITQDEIGIITLDFYYNQIKKASRFIDCFEEYGDNNSLLSDFSFVKPTANQNFTLSLDNTNMFNTGKALRVDYSGISYTPYYSAIMKKLMKNNDFSSYSGISIDLKPDGSNNSFTVVLEDSNGRYFNYKVSQALFGYNIINIKIPFSSFTLSQGSGEIDLTKITNMFIFFGAVSYDTSYIYVDNMMCYN